ncbi:MAG: TIGR00730 family Rossman fold protein [Pseudomonadota bacterium]
MKSICVFCGSRDGALAAYGADADALGRELAEQGFRLVYGAGDIGLMGRVARAAQAAGGQTFGVIPAHLLEKEVGKRDLTAFIVTETMHERKKVMFSNSDAVVALPGGPGTLDELFEVLTWRQLGLHARPIILLNTGGYWDPLIALIDHVVDQGFAAESFRAFLQVETTVAGVMTALAAVESRLAPFPTDGKGPIGS